MNDKDLIQELKRLSVRSIQCLGCGHEHECSTHSCAIIKQAVERLKVLTAPEPNDPLTLEELREMIGKPLWVVPLGKEPDWKPCWVICEEDYIFVPSEVNESLVHLLRLNKDYGKTWLAYRRKPEAAS